MKLGRERSKNRWGRKTIREKRRKGKLREGKGEDKNKGNNGWKVQEKVAEGLISFPKR